ncbi:DeoR/GlpR transcriptional regulator, partial [Bacillus vallismortis]|nr:DeoR/GlpR transcriptional regulator [Bacillus vallismortis]
KLEEQKAINRTSGGAILPTEHQKIQSYSGRLKTVSEEKTEIGRLSASLIHNGERVILDASTTVQACAEHFNADDCTLITNSINLAEVLSD